MKNEKNKCTEAHTKKKSQKDILKQISLPPNWKPVRNLYNNPAGAHKARETLHRRPRKGEGGKCMGTHFLPEVSSQGAQCRCYCWLWVEDQYTIPKCHSLLKRANRVRRGFKLDRSLKAELASRSLAELVLYVCVRQGGGGGGVHVQRNK